MAKRKETELLPPTMSVAEFRKLAGKKSEQFNDEQITDIVNELTLCADLYIKNLKSAQEDKLVPKPP